MTKAAREHCYFSVLTDEGIALFLGAATFDPPSVCLSKCLTTNIYEIGPSKISVLPLVSQHEESHPILRQGL